MECVNDIYDTGLKKTQLIYNLETDWAIANSTAKYFAQFTIKTKEKELVKKGMSLKNKNQLKRITNRKDQYLQLWFVNGRYRKHEETPLKSFCPFNAGLKCTYPIYNVKFTNDYL